MTVRTQWHIHLDSELGAGPEFAPVNTWKVEYPSRMEVSHTYMNIRFTATGKLRLNTVKSGGEPVRRVDLRYNIKVDAQGLLSVEERKELLYSLMGKRVYLVDNIHPDDGEDHTTYIQTYVLISPIQIKEIDPGLSKYYAAVELVHDNAS